MNFLFQQNRLIQTYYFGNLNRTSSGGGSRVHHRRPQKLFNKTTKYIIRCRGRRRITHRSDDKTAVLNRSVQMTRVEAHCSHSH